MTKIIHTITKLRSCGSCHFLNKLIVIVIFSMLIINCSSPNLSSVELETYIKNNYLSPQEYVISKFLKYDYVFIGEQHRIKHDVNFIENLIPELYKNGIKNLAIEFGVASNQMQLDSLLSLKQWDKNFAYEIASKGFYITWGYKEYLDIIKQAWKLNQTLEEDQQKFRIIYLDSDYFSSKRGIARTGGIDRDSNMSKIFQEEVINKNEKALVYTGIHHAFTRYNQPMYGYKKSDSIWLNSNRFGNLIHKKYPGHTFAIFLHAPWQSKKRWSRKAVKSVNGVIDDCMANLNNIPVGFDVKETPFGELNSDNSLYSLEHPDFKLKDFCDGYIFIKPYSSFEKVSVADGFYSENNLNKIKEYFKGIGISEEKVDKWNQETIEKIINDEGNFVIKNAKRLK